MCSYLGLEKRGGRKGGRGKSRSRCCGGNVAPTDQGDQGDQTKKPPVPYMKIP